MSLCVYINTWPLYTLEKFLVYFPEWIISPLIRSLSTKLLSISIPPPTLPLFIEYCLASEYNQIFVFYFLTLRTRSSGEWNIFFVFDFSFVLDLLLATVYRKLPVLVVLTIHTWPSSTRFVTLTSIFSSLTKFEEIIMKFESILTIRYAYYTLLRKDVTTATVLNFKFN